MYLSRIELDLKKRDAMRALNNPNMIHGAIAAVFSEEDNRILRRIDRIGDKAYLLIASPCKADLSHIARQFGTGIWDSADYQPLLDRIVDGGTYRFRLVANPTISVSSESRNGRGMRHAHISTQYQEKWLLDRCGKYGFYTDLSSFGVVGSKWYSFKKRGEGPPVRLLAVAYEGILKVTNAEKLKKSLVSGIGRGKAYGLGLMTVIRLKGVAR